MANPFLVLGGIAISVAAAAFGILQVPGWVASAQDASAANDLANVSQAAAVTVSQTGKQPASLAALSADTGMNLATASEDLFLHAGTKGWCATARSASGTYFARTSESSKMGSGPTLTAATEAVGCADAVACEEEEWKASAYSFERTEWYAAGCLSQLHYTHKPSGSDMGEPPLSGMPREWYTAMFERVIDEGAGLYTFTAIFDDNVLVRIDGTEVFYQRGNTGGQPVTFTVPLSEGPHQIFVEHVQGGQTGRLNLSWTVTR